MTLTFLEAVALAGLFFLAGEVLVARLPVLRTYYIPEPLVGGLLAAFTFWGLRGAGLAVEFPTHGRPVDFLVSLLTTNMGLTPKVVRQGWRLFFLFFGAGVVLYFVQLLLVLPVALFTPHPLPTALLIGPPSFVGAPFNLNPPDQAPLMASVLQPAYPNATDLSRGVMMLGAVTGICLAGVLGKRLQGRIPEAPPERSPEERRVDPGQLWQFALGETRLVILVLGLIAAAFAAQELLQGLFPGFRRDYVPVILLSYFFGAAVRQGYERLVRGAPFPEQALTALLLGPTMALVLTYAVMSLPLHLLAGVSSWMLLGGLLAITGSAVVAWLVFPLFARCAEPYYAAVVATAFLAVTTGWGPVGMAYMRQFTDQEGPVEPMPTILPLNALYLFPWTAVLLSHALAFVFGGAW